MKKMLDAKLSVGLVVGFVRNGKSHTRGYGRITAGRDEVPDGNTVYEIGRFRKPSPESSWRTRWRAES